MSVALQLVWSHLYWYHMVDRWNTAGYVLCFWLPGKHYTVEQDMFWCLCVSIKLMLQECVKSNVLTGQFCDSCAKTWHSAEYSRYCGSQLWSSFLFVVDVSRSNSGKFCDFLSVVQYVHFAYFLFLVILTESCSPEFQLFFERKPTLCCLAVMMLLCIKQSSLRQTK